MVRWSYKGPKAFTKWLKLRYCQIIQNKYHHFEDV